MTPLGRLLKRTIDALIALFCIIVFAPLFVVCYIAIKLDDHGPALYKQERIGHHGKPFYIYKFRSMSPNAEATDTPMLLNADGDPRLTKTGKFLRAHHLDELPQIWNVLVGDMAFVGPRPERRYFIDQIMQHDPRYEYLYQIRPGVTSYATLYNGYTDTMDKMLRRLHYDLYYLEHRSFLFDCKVLWRTFWRIVRGDRF
ncbi:MAG: sugar transferase [Bacteroidales bacterium]|nr:sugar transferase [Bacteroidales bacterium]